MRSTTTKKKSVGKKDHCITPGAPAKLEKTERKVKHSFLFRPPIAVSSPLSRL